MISVVSCLPLSVPAFYLMMKMYRNGKLDSEFNIHTAYLLATIGKIEVFTSFLGKNPSPFDPIPICRLKN